MTYQESCPHDHTRLTEDLRKLPTPALGRLLAPLLPAVLNGDAGPSTWTAARLVGDALSDRKAAA